MDYKEAKRIINNFKYKKEVEEEIKKKQYDTKLNNAINDIKTLQEEIKEILKIGNLCLTEGIETNPTNRNTYRKCLYADGAYETDAIYHQLGFYPNRYNGKIGKCTHYDYIGYRAGGANGNWDFITNGDLVAIVPFRDCYKPEISVFKTPNLYYCNNFLKDFPTFKEMFYNYINNLEED